MTNIRLVVAPDPDACAPDDFMDDPVWLVHFHRDFHHVPKSAPVQTRAEAAEFRSNEKYEVFVLASYIHGGVSLAILGTPEHATMPDKQWDVSVCGLLIIDKAHWRRDINSDASETDWPKIAKDQIAQWNAYLSGDVWRYTVYEDDNVVESCGNFYDKADAEAEGKSLLEIYQLSALKRKAEFSEKCKKLDQALLDKLLRETPRETLVEFLRDIGKDPFAEESA